MLRRLYRLLKSFLLLVAAAAPALVAGGEPVRSLLELRHQGVVVQRWDMSCGAAALATVLTYALKDPVSEKAIAEAMLRRTDPLRVKVRGGFSLLDMKRYAESRGHSAQGFRAVSLDELAAMPHAVVPIDEHGDAHFVVVRGLRHGQVDLADPAFGNRLIPVERFSEIWKDGIAFVVTRRVP